MSSPSEAPGDPAPEGALDARASDPVVAAGLDAWLELQDALCLRPARATAWLLEEGGDPARVRSRVKDRARRGRVDLSRWRQLLARLGALLVPQPAAAFPPALRLIPDPPPVLIVRGRVELLHRPAVAIVGARAPTAYGRAVARELGAGLARSGAVVISGLARGVDAAAHEGALEAGGWTVAVTACGPEVVYPPEHARLAERIASTGAVVTELPPGRQPLRAHFPLRNRLISGLARGVVVVEARAGSGSLITAGHALDQAREVLAVPGPIHAPTSLGPNRLLRDGASAVTGLGDVLDAVGLGTVATANRHPDSAAPKEPSDAGDAGLLALLREEPLTPDELVERLGCSPRQLALRLLGLELDGLVVTDRDGRLRATAGTST